ncbi:MAG: hypothetical protein WDN26_06875 [Chitinophagaceae bacterium]
MEIFIDVLEKMAKEENPLFKEHIAKFSRSKSSTQLRLLLYGYLAKPESYATHIAKLTVFIGRNHGFEHSDKLQYLLRKAIGEAFSYLEVQERKKFIEYLLSINIPRESGVFTEPGTHKKHIFRGHGRTLYQYLSAIPQDKLFEHFKAKQRFQELHRKFGKN